MSNAERALPEHLTTLVCRTEGRQFMFPDVAIAEIVEFQSTTTEDDMPTWYLGKLAWRDMAIPLVSLEALNHESFFGQSLTLKIVIVNSMHGDSAMPYWGFVALETPKLVRLNQDSLVPSDDVELGQVEAMQAVYAGEMMSIPNLEKMELMLKDLLKA